MNLFKAKFLPSNIIPFPRIIRESQFAFHASRITFSFIKTRVIFASSPSLKQFRNPSSLSPSHPVQSSCSLSHVTEGCIQSPVEQGKQLPARSSLGRSLLYPPPWSARLCSFTNRNNPQPSTPLPWGPGKLGGTVPSDMQHIPSATTAGRMSRCRIPGLWSHASDQEKTEFHLPVCFLQEC